MQEYGGISRYFCKIGESLVAKEENVLFSAPAYINKYLRKSIPKNNIFGIQFSSQLNIYLRKFLNRAFSPLVANIYRPNLIHETGYSIRSRQCYKSPVVITVFDLIHEIYPEEFASEQNASFVKKRSIERADHLICISNNTKNDLIRFYGVDPSKISTIYLGADSFDINAHLQRDRKLVNKNPFILYVGERAGYKNFSRFFLAYAESKLLIENLDLIVFGAKKFTRKEADLFRAFNLEHKVKHVSGADSILAELYQTASLMVYPSLYEGFGIPPLEAMAFGCPVIASNTSSIAELLHGTAPLFNPYDQDDIKDKMENILQLDPNQKDGLITKGLELSNKFTWERCAAETIDLYRKLIKI